MSNQTYTLTLRRKLVIKILNLKLIILLLFQTGLEKPLLLQKFKILFRGDIPLVILKVKKLLEHFGKKNRKKQKEFKVEKVMERKGDKLYVKWKGHNNLYDSWIDKKYIV